MSSETRKERVQVTLLLALGVPCSAQLGVLMGMVGRLGLAAVAVWGGVVVATVLGLLPGARVQLLQRRPAPVVHVGETELAIGLELLEQVRVSEP